MEIHRDRFYRAGKASMSKCRIGVQRGHFKYFNDDKLEKFAKIDESVKIMFDFIIKRRIKKLIYSKGSLLRVETDFDAAISAKIVSDSRTLSTAESAD